MTSSEVFDAMEARARTRDELLAIRARRAELQALQALSDKLDTVVREVSRLAREHERAIEARDAGTRVCVHGSSLRLPCYSCPQHAGQGLRLLHSGRTVPDTAVRT